MMIPEGDVLQGQSLCGKASQGGDDDVSAGGEVAST
jgi:hypothetical protein